MDVMTAYDAWEFLWLGDSGFHKWYSNVVPVEWG